MNRYPISSKCGTIPEEWKNAIGGRFRHYKGNEYEVVGIAAHSETLEPMVVYRQLYGEHALWVRPASMFFEEVEVDGRMVRRFKPVGPDDIAANAVAAFHRPPENFNCAQAVASALGADDATVVADKANGGGRAEGGLCGALFAALRAAPPEKHEELKAPFAKVTGSTMCREIKGKFKTPCEVCVSTAARLAAEL